MNSNKFAVNRFFLGNCAEKTCIHIISVIVRKEKQKDGEGGGGCTDR